MKGDRYAFSGDWWSLGVTLLELLTGAPALASCARRRQCPTVRHGRCFPQGRRRHCGTPLMLASAARGARHASAGIRIAGKKPFKKKFQKYKNTDDKIRIVKPGQLEDKIEERGLEDRFKCAAPP